MAAGEKNQPLKVALAREERETLFFDLSGKPLVLKDSNAPTFAQPITIIGTVKTKETGKTTIKLTGDTRETFPSEQLFPTLLEFGSKLSELNGSLTAVSRIAEEAKRLAEEAISKPGLKEDQGDPGTSTAEAEEFAKQTKSDAEATTAAKGVVETLLAEGRQILVDARQVKTDAEDASKITLLGAQTAETNAKDSEVKTEEFAKQTGADLAEVRAALSNILAIRDQVEATAKNVNKDAAGVRESQEITQELRDETKGFMDRSETAATKAMENGKQTEILANEAKTSSDEAKDSVKTVRAIRESIVKIKPKGGENIMSKFIEKTLGMGKIRDHHEQERVVRARAAAIAAGPTHGIDDLTNDKMAREQLVKEGVLPNKKRQKIFKYAAGGTLLAAGTTGIIFGLVLPNNDGVTKPVQTDTTNTETNTSLSRAEMTIYGLDSKGNGKDVIVDPKEGTMIVDVWFPWLSPEKTEYSLLITGKDAFAAIGAAGASWTFEEGYTVSEVRDQAERHIADRRASGIDVKPVTLDELKKLFPDNIKMLVSKEGK